jgi:hypothetical protein
MADLLMIEAFKGWKSMKPKIERFEITDPELLALVSEEMDRWLNSWTLDDHIKYGGQYVAVSANREVVASDKSASRLEKKLRDLGSPKVRVFLLETPGVRVIYSVQH